MTSKPRDAAPSILALLCALLVGLTAVGCGSDDTDGNNGGTNNGADAGDADPTDGGQGDGGQDDGGQDDGGADTAAQVCEPGQVVACRGENTQAVDRCNDDGTGTEQSSCPASHVCREGACVEVNCIPGHRRCASDSQPQACDEAGDAYQDIAACVDGELCEEGFCLDRCAIAERTGSYIGCEYWAVELENHLLNADDDSGQPLPDDQLPPFAIVLANTSTTYDAEVSVYTGDGELAEAIGSRTVASDITQPGTDYVTVHSELVDGNGTRMQGPIDGAIDRVPLPRGSLLTLVLPHRAVAFGESTIEQLGYKVESTQPIVAYQFNPLCCNYNYTNDASLLLPTSALTENYMYMSYAVWNGGQNRTDVPYSPTMTVVATEADTVVDITLPPTPLDPTTDQPRPYADLIYPFGVGGERVSGPDANGRMSVTLQPFEVLNVAGAGRSETTNSSGEVVYDRWPADLTGALIEASKPVSVFGGHTCAYVPFNSPACDHLESQLFPLETWGRRFVAAALKLRGENPEGTREGTYWKFLAREDGTRIQTGIDLSRGVVLPPADEGVKACSDFSADPVTGIIELDRGQTCEFGTRQLFVAESNKPIMVGAFLSGQNSVTRDASWGTHAGDPAFFLVPPEEQYRTGYSFLTPETYFVSYVTVTLQPGVNVTLDGQTLDLAEYDYEVVPERGIARAHIPVDEGPHKIEAATPFGIVVYGYDDYVSYAYTGGLNLTKLTPWE